MTETTTTTERIMIRILHPFAMVVACVCWIAIGLVSMRRLGRVLVRTGENLSEYDW